MKPVSSRFRFWTILLCCLAGALLLLLMTLFVSALFQVSRSSQEKAVTFSRTLAHAISGLVRDAADQEGRLVAILEEVAGDEQIRSVGIIREDGLLLLERGPDRLPTLPGLSTEVSVWREEGGDLVVLRSFTIQQSCVSRDGGCPCVHHHQACNCTNPETWALPAGRYGLAMRLHVGVDQRVRWVLIGSSAVSLLALAGLLVAMWFLFQSYRTRQNLLARVALEQQRNESLESLRSAAAGLAHEIRNPLGAVSGYVQLLHEQVVEPRQREWTRLMLSALERISDRLEEFLGFARKRRSRTASVNLNQLVNDSVALMAVDAESQQISLSHRAPDVDVCVAGDAFQLKEAIINLILNALQHTPPQGAVEVTLSAKPTGPAIVICDTGVGIAQDHLAHVFSPYFTTRKAGVGLGLAISRRIAEDHGAILTVVNRPDGGVMATLTFVSKDVLSGDV